MRGVRVVDWLIAGALTAMGVVLMALDTAAYGRSVWMIPVFAAATVPVLWWRRSTLAVTAVALAVMVVHDLLFGWVTRCGAGLPLAFTLVFLGALTYERTKALLTLALTVALCFAVLVVDGSAGPGAMVLAAPVTFLLFGVGRAARQRSALNRRLRSRDEELRRLRDERAALMVADDRARLSGRLDGLLQERLGELTRAAESADGLPPAQAKELLARIETGGRQTMDDMRELVGLLRSGEVDLTPAPTVAHLEALLARTESPRSRLTVSGDPRALPATVELSAYRIVEYLVEALGGLEVAVRFCDDALEIRVNGSVGRGAEVRAAVTRVRERARLLGGSVDVKVTRGRAHVVAQLPVPG
ncbi:sensor histidine kinase [Actinoplanes sp. URMC 104]|uniref:sensor histidine kinase n=1 Tax=Actinoplanes sp. URMC 104 TaxID=3423409 RepID=UPI003F1C8D0F